MAHGIVGLPALPAKVRIVLTAYSRRAGVYKTIPGAAASAYVNTPTELRRLYNAIWKVIEDGTWLDESNDTSE